MYFIASFNLGNAPPVVTLPDQITLNEDSIVNVLVPIIDDLLTLDQLDVSVSASPSSLIDVNDILLNPFVDGLELGIRPRPDQFGMGTVTLVVSDSLHTVGGTFTLEVLPVADAPRIMPVSDRTVTGNEPFDVEILISDPDTPLTELQLTLTSNFEELLPVHNAPVAITSSPTILSFVPGQGPFGIGEITVRVQALDGLSTEEAFQVQVTDPAREETPPVNLRLVRTNNGAPETLYLSWIGEMDVYVADQLLGPYRLVEGVSSPFQPAVEPDGKFYKLVPRSRP
jgi:hypothetical protein